MLTAAMIPGNLLAEESLSPGDDSAALESAADLSAAEGNAVTMSDLADEAAGNTAVKTGEGEDQTGENPAQAEVPGGPGEAKEPSETEKADAAEDTDKTGRTDPAEDTVETGEADKTGGSEQTGEQPVGPEDSQTEAELADDGPGDRYFSGGGCLCDPSGDDHVGDAAGERAEL